jgi:hypothetical protein
MKAKNPGDTDRRFGDGNREYGELPPVTETTARALLRAK